MIIIINKIVIIKINVCFISYNVLFNITLITRKMLLIGHKMRRNPQEIARQMLERNPQVTRIKKTIQITIELVVQNHRYTKHFVVFFVR